jgi:uncharacterized surface protein with fasciclin (FAS1) repeats
MRNTLLMAAAATALMAAPALAQEMPTGDATTQPPSTDPIGTAPPAETPPSTPETTDPVDEASPDATMAAQPDPAAEMVTADAGSTDDIVDVMRADGQFTSLLQALDATGLTETLESDDSISILAPTDAAFAVLPAGEVERLMLEENREELRELLLYHVLNADVRPEQIENRRGPVVTGSGSQILLDGVGGLRADAATITNAELRGSNGAILVVDQVLSPETSLAAQGDEDAEAAAEAEVGAEDAEVAADADVAAEAGVVADAGVAAADTETPATTEEPTGAEMPSTPPVDEGDPTDPVADEEPATPES